MFRREGFGKRKQENIELEYWNIKKEVREID